METASSVSGQRYTRMYDSFRHEPVAESKLAQYAAAAASSPGPIKREPYYTPSFLGKPPTFDPKTSPTQTGSLFIERGGLLNVYPPPLVQHSWKSVQPCDEGARSLEEEKPYDDGARSLDKEYAMLRDAHRQAPAATAAQPAVEGVAEYERGWLPCDKVVSINTASGVEPLESYDRTWELIGDTEPSQHLHPEPAGRSAVERHDEPGIEHFCGMLEADAPDDVLASETADDCLRRHAARLRGDDEAPPVQDWDFEKCSAGVD